MIEFSIHSYIVAENQQNNALRSSSAMSQQSRSQSRPGILNNTDYTDLLTKNYHVFAN